MTGNCELRFGNTAALLFTAMGEKPMKQLDLLDLFFPCLFVAETEAAGNSMDAEFDDQNMVIRAVRKNNSLHVGSGRRVSQILGRLCGTAKGNQEKERRTALLLQKKAAEVICTDREYMLVLQDNIREIINVLNDESREAFVILLGIFLTELSYREKEECDPDILFPLDPEVFEGIVYHAIKQFKSGDWEGIRNAWLWILIGSLLRNESGRVLRFYDSSFIMVNRMPSEEETFEDRLNFLLHPEEYESVYYGDDLDRKYPGIEFYCDACGAHLNRQEGFDDHQNPWKCTECGHENEISENVIYNSEEDWRMGKGPLDGQDIMKAIQRRREEQED